MAATLDSTWILAHGIHDLGIGLFTHLKDGGVGGLQLCMAIDPEQGVDAPPAAAMAVALKSTQKALDCQTFILSLSAKGLSHLCRHLPLFETPLTHELESMIALEDDENCDRSVRDFKSKLEATTLAYEPLAERLIKTVSATGSNKLSNVALRDAAKAEMHANTLYSWARTFIPKHSSNSGSQTAITKAARLQMMPYIVAMAYAVRIKLDVFYVEGSAVDQAERLEYWERGRSVVEQFKSAAQNALRALLIDSSLLDVAIDYHLALTTYTALMATLRKSVQTLLATDDVPETIQLWDDGLAKLRSIFCRDDASRTTAIIPLDTLEEVVAWAQIAGRDLKSLKFRDLRDTVQLQELYFILGVDQEDDQNVEDGNDNNHDNEDVAFCLAPDYKRTFVTMPSAHSLHTAIHNRLADIVIGLEPAVLTSIARIRIANHTTNALAIAAPSAPLKPPRLVHTLEYDSGVVDCVAVSADGERAFSGSSTGATKVWSTTTGQALWTVAESVCSVTCVALFSDGTRAVLAGGGNCNSVVRIWSLDTGAELRVFRGHTETVNGVAVSLDNRIIASASQDETVRLWNAVTGLTMATLTHCNETAQSVAFSPDGQTLVSGGVNNTIRVWRVRTKQLLCIIERGSQFNVTGVEFMPDGERLVRGSNDTTISVWNWRTGELERTFSGHKDSVKSIAVFPDGERIVSGSSDATVRIWNLHSGELEHTLEGHTDPVLSVAVSRDGRTLVSGSHDGSIRVWALEEAADGEEEPSER